jgi:prepilin-type N-terminal cleavage/methylation domain-containing protein
MNTSTSISEDGSKLARLRGFTLIELLVVIGIIALLAAAIGVGLRGGDQTIALQGGQATLSSMVSATRGRAAIAGANARLLVYADPSDPDRYMRYLAIAVETSASPSTYTIVSDAVLLPNGIYIVPPGTVPVGDNPAWPANLRSGALDSTTVSLAESMGSPIDWYYFQMTKFGSNSSTGSNLVLSPGERSEDGVIFNNAANVRGLKISIYGTVTFIDDATGF